MDNLSKKTITQITKPLQKIRQTFKYIYSQNANKQAHTSTHNYIVRMCRTMQTAQIKSAKKIEILILQFIMQKKQKQNTKRAQKQIFMYTKIHVNKTH